MGKEVRVLLGTVTLRFRAKAIEVVVIVFGYVGSLVGILSGYCPIHQLALQLVFGSVWVPDWYLEWFLPGLPECDYGP